MITSAHEAWREARTLAEVAELTALWLEGQLNYHPAYGNGPDNETAPLVAALAAFNRAGFLTEFSQPGEAGSWGAQRAAVSGFCDEGVADLLYEVSTTSDLIVLCFRAGALFHGQQAPVTRDSEGIAATWAGAPSDVEYLDTCYGHAGPQLVEMLSACWQVTVIDAQWGRDDLLWHTIRSALGS